MCLFPYFFNLLLIGAAQFCSQFCLLLLLLILRLDGLPAAAFLLLLLLLLSVCRSGQGEAGQVQSQQREKPGGCPWTTILKAGAAAAAGGAADRCKLVMPACRGPDRWRIDALHG